MNTILDLNDDLKPQFYGYASFGQRLVASIIDGIIMNIVTSISGFVFGLGTFSFNTDDDFNLIAMLGGAMALSVNMILNVLYFAYFESSEKQATFGKQAMGIVVTDMRGERITFMNAVGRYFAKFISMIILFIGYIMQAFDSKGQALHDKLAGTLVYKK